eukprot:m.130009 g.130009  ORF g.130009 m.130009 type:complete len:79 (-) comp14591_c1_seq2:203-439(-)
MGHVVIVVAYHYNPSEWMRLGLGSHKVYLTPATQTLRHLLLEARVNDIVVLHLRIHETENLLFSCLLSLLSNRHRKTS